MQNLPPAQFEDPKSDLKGTATVKITDATVEVQCDLTRKTKDEEEFAVVHFHMFQLARTFSDMAAFMTGKAMTFVLDEFVNDEGVERQLQPSDPILAPICSVNINDVIYPLMRSPQIAMALNTLTSTLDRPHVIAVNSAIAIESVAQLLAPGEPDKKRWPIMRAKLNLTKDYLTFVTERSQGPRHGDWTMQPSCDQVETRKRAWTVFNRYLEFIKRGGINELPRALFPLL